MVILEAEIIGVDNFRTAASNIRSLEKSISKRVVKSVTKVPKTSYVDIKSLYKRSPTRLANITAELDAKGDDITEEVIVFNEGTVKGRKLGSVRTSGQTVNTVINKFRKEYNTIFIAIPSISNDKIIAINPKPSDLVVKKDHRGKNLYSVGLTSVAVKRITKEFSDNVEKLIREETQKLNFDGRPRTSGIKFDVAAKLGVAADTIHIMPSIIGKDLTEEVRKQVAQNMSTDTGTMSYSRSIAMDKLVNRTGSFVQSIRNVRVKDKTAIGYTYDEKTYGIHEKPIGTTTTIYPRNSKVLVFTNKKTGEKVFTRKAVVKSRPVIRKSIREVALRLFGRRFNAEKDR